MKYDKPNLNLGRNCEGAKRSGKNGATLQLASVRRNRKRSLKAKAKQTIEADNNDA